MASPSQISVAVWVCGLPTEYGNQLVQQTKHDVDLRSRLVKARGQTQPDSRGN